MRLELVAFLAVFCSAVLFAQAPADELHPPALKIEVEAPPSPYPASALKEQASGTLTFYAFNVYKGITMAFLTPEGLTALIRPQDSVVEPSSPNFLLFWRFKDLPDGQYKAVFDFRIVDQACEKGKKRTEVSAELAGKELKVKIEYNPQCPEPKLVPTVNSRDIAWAPFRGRSFLLIIFLRFRLCTFLQPIKYKVNSKFQMYWRRR